MISHQSTVLVLVVRDDRGTITDAPRLRAPESCTDHAPVQSLPLNGRVVELSVRRAGTADRATSRHGVGHNPTAAATGGAA